MIRISKETDYGIVLLSCLAQAADASLSASALAERGRLPLPTVSKVLKLLARGGLLVSQRGARGGYALARPPREITVAEIIAVIDGPIALTDCSPGGHGDCGYQGHCQVSGHWGPISRAISTALEGVTLADLLRPQAPAIVTVPFVIHHAVPGSPSA
mgnify:FL=1